MKKFLFTLASLVGLGFAANAAAPTMAFTAGANSTEPITEITMAPGETMEIGFCILSTDEAIKGWQTNFEMRKPDGTLYIGTEKGTEVWGDFGGVNYLVQTPMGIPGIHFEFLQDYGNEDKWEWFKQVNSISSNANNTVSNSNGANKQTSAYDSEGAYMPGNAYGVDNVNTLYTGMANLIMTNGATGTCFPKRGATYPWTVIVFTITTEQNWSEEYAEIVMTKADYVYASGQQVGDFLTLKINNSAPQTAAANPVFTWDGDNYTMTISEGTLYLDGEAVASPYVVEKADADRLLHFSAKNGNSDLVYYNVIVPAGEGAEPTVDINEPNIRVDGDGTLEATVTITADEGLTIYYSFTGEDADDFAVYTEPIVKDEAGNYTVYAYAMDGEGNKSDVVNKPFSVRAETTAPEPAFREADGKLYAEKEGYTVNMQMLVDGEWQDVANPYELPAQQDVAQEIKFRAQTVAIDEDNNSAWVETTVTIPALPQPDDLTGELIISDCTEGLNGEGPGGYFTVTYNGPETVEIAVTYETGAKAALEPNDEGKYRLPNYGTYDVKAVASATSYNDKEATKTLVWRQPESQPATEVEVTKNDDHTTVTLTPNGNNPVIEGGNTLTRPEYGQGDQTVTVTVTTTDEGYAPKTVEIEVVIPEQLPTPEIQVTETPVDAWLIGDGTAENPYQEGTEENGATLHHGTAYVLNFDVPAGYEVHFTLNGEEHVWDGQPYELEGEGNVDIVAWVVAGDDESPRDTDNVTLIHNNFTGVNELMNGKAVAGVRYFNLAGQEMQEANGITIVVTTYTDGTTSAVKVMK